MLKILKIIGLTISGFLALIIILPSSNIPPTPTKSDTNTSTSTVIKTNNAATEKTSTPVAPPKTEESAPAPISVVAEVAVTPPAPVEYLVTRIVDGDTIELSDGRKVRYIGIDTPESVKVGTPIECFGKEAAKKNSEVILNKMVKLVKDVSETDRYGRLLRYVYIDDLFVNDYMVREGYAMAYTYPPDVKFSKQFVASEQYARDNKLGLWADGACPDTMSNTQTPSANAQEVSHTTGTHTWYTSSYYSSKFYYCDTNDQWKSLSTKYLKSFSSAEELLKAYPSRQLHEACK